PRMAFVEQHVNIKDLLNTEIGGLIRCTAPPDGVFRELTHRFVGGDTLPMMDRIDDIQATRTGMTKASQGLDPKILQSTEKAAVGATLSKAQERLEIRARIFARSAGVTDGVTEVESSEPPAEWSAPPLSVTLEQHGGIEGVLKRADAFIEATVG
ncbi:MAG: hypothetical protein IIB38_13740, partial [Candidatus Hydrogenedentes bacterium]|nr:hypothetical protein [Candidatus Hydrogenedentota bacterium]